VTIDELVPAIEALADKVGPDGVSYRAANGEPFVTLAFTYPENLQDFGCSVMLGAAMEMADAARLPGKPLHLFWRVRPSIELGGEQPLIRCRLVFSAKGTE
jgi:hypothetical protein